VPTWTRLHPSDGKVWQLKLPQHINLEANPYEADYYRGQLTGEDDSLRGSEAKARMLDVRNTMRWRWVTGPDGKPTKQANARILRWSDGSMSLQLGQDMYDVQSTWGTTVARESDKYERTEANSKGSQETSFVCYAAAEEQVLVAETAVEGQLNLVPTSMDSKTHREHVKLVGQQHTKHSRMRLLEDEAAGDRLQELLARAGPQKAAPVKKSTRRAPGTGEPRNTFGRRSAFGRATKRADSEESEEDAGPRNRAGGGYDEDDGFVVADSDEDDDYGGRKKSKRRHDDDDMDATELAEARIAAREKRERKRAKTKKSRAYSDDEDDEEDAAGEPDEEDDAEMEMDVESEEE
jgi:RNA polymerase-associated protein LEO1